MKKIAFIILVLFLCNSISAQRYFEANGIRYKVLTEADEASTFGTVSIAKPEVGEYEDDIVIPNVVKESEDQYADVYKVIGIEEQAFSESKYLHSVELPASIENIGKEAFKSSSLTKISIPTGNLTEIAESTFEDTKLISIKIPTTVKKINDRAFADCIFLAEVIIGEGVTDIGKEAFMNCYKIEKIVLPNSLRIIGDCCFIGCFRINSIVCGSNLKRIGRGTFYNCTSLRHIELPEGIKEIGPYAFGSSGLLDIEIPESLREIKEGVFANSMLRSVSLPQQLRIIGKYAFCGLYLNDSIKIPESVDVAQNAFENTSYDINKLQSEKKKFLNSHKKELIKVSLGNENIQIALGERSFLLIINKNMVFSPITIPANDNEYGTMKMCGIDYRVVSSEEIEIEKYGDLIGDIIIPDIVEIKDGSWKGKYIITAVGSMKNCYNIKKLRLPITIEKPFEPEQFCHSSITNVNIPEGITIIPNLLFYSCLNLQEVSLPQTLKSIGELAFAKTLISSIDIPTGTDIIGERAFSTNRKLVKVNLPSNIKIGRGCFRGTPFGEEYDKKNGEKNSENEKYDFENPKYANNEEFEKFKKQLDIYFHDVISFLDDKKNLDLFPTSGAYTKEYRQLYKQSLDKIKADSWMYPHFKGSFNPFSSYRRKFENDMENKEARNSGMLP